MEEMSSLCAKLCRELPLPDFKRALVPDLVDCVALGASRGFKQLVLFHLSGLGIFLSLHLRLFWNPLNHFSISVQSLDPLRARHLRGVTSLNP